MLGMSGRLWDTRGGRWLPTTHASVVELTRSAFRRKATGSEVVSGSLCSCFQLFHACASCSDSPRRASRSESVVVGRGCVLPSLSPWRICIRSGLSCRRRFRRLRPRSVRRTTPCFASTRSGWGRAGVGHRGRVVHHARLCKSVGLAARPRTCEPTWGGQRRHRDGGSACLSRGCQDASAGCRDEVRWGARWLPGSEAWSCQHLALVVLSEIRAGSTDLEAAPSPQRISLGSEIGAPGLDPVPAAPFQAQPISVSS